MGRVEIRGGVSHIVSRTRVALAPVCLYNTSVLIHGDSDMPYYSSQRRFGSTFGGRSYRSTSFGRRNLGRPYQYGPGYISGSS